MSIEDFFPPREVELADFYPDGIPNGNLGPLNPLMDKAIPPMMASWVLQFMEAESNAATKKIELLRMLKFLSQILKVFDPELHERINA